MHKQRITMMLCILGLAMTASALVPKNVFAGEWKGDFFWMVVSE